MGRTAPPSARFAGTRPLKRWRYVGVFGEDLMLCAGQVRIAGAPQAFWAVWDRRSGVLRERTRKRPWRVQLADGVVRVRDDDVRVDLRLESPTAPHEAVAQDGAGTIWTRKHGARAVGAVWLGGVQHPVDAHAIVDDSAGHHGRETTWRWCAGVGQDLAGRALLWNLVTGIHDGPFGSERAVWVDGVPREVGPVTFAGDLGGVAFAEGGGLAFTAEATRERHDAFAGLVRSDYVQPFGTFTGELPGVGPLATGFGVMEAHSARW